MRKGSKNMTEARYEQVRGLLRLGLQQKKIASIMSISGPTVSRVSRSEDWEDYRRIVRESNSFYKERAAKAAKELVFANLPDGVDSEPVAPLVRIAIAMERLADAWENAPLHK